LAEETEVLGTNLPECHFVHHKPHIMQSGITRGPQRWAAALARQLLELTSIFELMCASESEVPNIYRYRPLTLS
jgi:hypothetical protein